MSPEPQTKKCKLCQFEEGHSFECPEYKEEKWEDKKETFEERIIREFEEKFKKLYILDYDSDAVDAYTSYTSCGEEIKYFILQSLSAQKSEMTAWAWKEIERWRFG